MKRDFLTVYEAEKESGLSGRYIRTLLEKGMLVGDRLPVTADRDILIVSKASLKAFLAKKRTPGPKPKSSH